MTAPEVPLRSPEFLYRAMREFEVYHSPGFTVGEWVRQQSVTYTELLRFAGWTSERYPGTRLDTAVQVACMAAYREEQAARQVKWRYVSGGRASHGFVGQSGVPLCGIVPERANGLPPIWRDAPPPGSRRSIYGIATFNRRNYHGECVRAARERGLLR
jgi:hypothetical protein